MKKKVLIVMLVISMLSTSVLAAVGPAPNAGDGISDGSGIDRPIQEGGIVGEKMPWDSADDPGAPNAGDGISDGSGW